MPSHESAHSFIGPRDALHIDQNKWELKGQGGDQNSFPLLFPFPLIIKNVSSSISNKKIHLSEIPSFCEFS